METRTLLTVECLSRWRAHCTVMVLAVTFVISKPSTGRGPGRSEQRSREGHGQQPAVAAAPSLPAPPDCCAPRCPSTSAFLAPPRTWCQHRDSPSSLAPLPLPRSLSQHPAARSTPASTWHRSLLPEPRSPASTEPPEPGTACPAAAPATHTSVQTSPQDRAACPGTPQTLMEAAGAARLPSVPAPMAQPSWHGRTPAPRCPFSLESSFSKSDLFHPWFSPQFLLQPSAGQGLRMSEDTALPARSRK